MLSQIISTIRHFYVPPKSATELAECHPVGGADADAVDADGGAVDAVGMMVSALTGLRSSPPANPSTGSSPAT